MWLSSRDQKERRETVKVSCIRPLFVPSARVGMNRIKVTRLPICYHNNHLRQPDIDITDMDDVRKSLSKLKKDLKHRIGGKKRGPDKAGANTAGERVGSPASPLRPGLRVEDARTSTDVLKTCSTDLPPHLQPGVAGEDCLNDPQGKEEDTDEKGVSRSRSSLDPDVEGAGSGPSRGIKLASSPLSVTPITSKQEPDGTWALSPQLLCLITLLDNTEASAVPDSVQPDPHPGENTEPSATANEKKLSWKSTALATAKLLLRGVRDSADAFGPLKSVAGGLCFILDNYEVWASPTCSMTTLTGTSANEGERADDRVVGTPSEDTCRIASFTCFRR